MNLMSDSRNTQEERRVDDAEEKTVVISGYLTHLQHRPLLPSVWRNRFWVLRSEGSLHCFRRASSKSVLIKFDLTDPTIRIRTGDPVSELKGVKWPRGVHNDRKLCIKLKRKCFFFFTADSTQLSAWDQSIHSVSDEFAFSSNWTLSSQKGKLSASEAPHASIHDMRGGEMRGVEAEDKEALLESYRQRKSVMARAQLATLFGSQPSPSISRVSNFAERGDMEPLSQRVQRLSDASSTVVTLKRRPSKAREVEKKIRPPVDEYGAFTFQPRAGAPPISPSTPAPPPPPAPSPSPVPVRAPAPEASERQRKTSHSQPKPTQRELSLARKGEEEEERNFLTKMERFRQLATQHELPMRRAGDLQRINRKPQRIRIPDQFMRPSDTPPPSPPRTGHRFVATGSNLASIKERMQPSGPGRHSPNQPPRSGRAKTRFLALKAAEQSYAARMEKSGPQAGEDPPPQKGQRDSIVPPPHAFLASPDVSEETVRLQEESLNELKQVLNEYSQPSEEKLAPPDKGEDSEGPPEESLRAKRPSFASMRMEAIKLEDSLDETRPSSPWRRPVPLAPSKSPLAREPPFSFSQGQEETGPPPEATRSLPLASPSQGVRDSEVVKGEDPAEEAKQDRVQKAVDWVGGEVQKLISEIRRLGVTTTGGRCEVEFGLLFSETSNQFDALTGILKTAKKLGVVSYDGEVLFQGVDDRRVISLLRQDLGEVSKEMLIRTPPVSPQTKRAGGSPPGKHRKFGAGTQQYGQNSCAVCGKPVYQMEFVGATDKAFHRWCFRCSVCQITLSPTNFATIADKYFCTVHYERAYLSAGGYRGLEGEPGPN